LNNQGFYFHLNITPFKQVNTTLDERDKKQRTASRKCSEASEKSASSKEKEKEKDGRKTEADKRSSTFSIKRREKRFLIFF
jgi:hypothetical protein